MINQTPTLPSPHVPRSLGAAIHQTYETGEWVANITADSVAIWYPDKASGTYKTFVHGNASARGVKRPLDSLWGVAMKVRKSYRNASQ